MQEEITTSVDVGEQTSVVIREDGNTDEFKVRYVEVTNSADALLLTTDDKWALLARLGIQRVDDGTPLRVWRNAMLAENGLEANRMFRDYGICMFDIEQALATFIWAIA